MKIKILFFILILGVNILYLNAQQKIISGERSSVDLTIYNQNLALIREERTINIPKGINYVIIPDIPSTIDGTSLHFSSLTEPFAVRVLEQNYQYDLVNQTKLLEKYIGKEIEFIRLNEETKKEYTVKAKLLATGLQAPQPYPGISQTGMVAEIEGKLELNPTGRLVLPSLPEGLILKPQLEWLVENTKPGLHQIEISYLANQLSWYANYVALLNKDDSKLEITGWVTLTNNTGTSFKDAGLKLVAGDVNILQEEFRTGRYATDMMMKTAEPQFKQTELFEYKLYTLKRKTNINSNETKQVELISAKNVSTKKVFIYDGLADQWRAWYRSYSYRNQSSFGQQSNPDVGVFVIFRNDERAGLGIPLPKGKVRVYKKDEDGKEQFIGEDRIDHTPKDEEIRLYLGNAFDIIGERAQIDFKTLASGRVIEETIRIKVRNHKSEMVEVLIYEHPWRWSEWEIIKTDTPWEKIDQSTIKFPVKIAKDEEKMVTYTIRYSW